MIAAGNIASHVAVMAKKQPDTTAVVMQKNGQQLTYQQLEECSNTIARGLYAAGINKGTRTVLMVKPSLEFFILVFALFKVGAIIVLVDPGIGIKNLRNCLNAVQPQAFIGNPTAHLARLLFGWCRHSLTVKVMVADKIDKFLNHFNIIGFRQLSDMADRAMSFAPTQTLDQAAILFTSGNTGSPKGVVYSHANFNAQLCALKDTYDIHHGEIDLSTFPLFALFAPAMGMTAVIPDMDFTHPAQVNAEKIFAAIQHFGVTTMFGSPALLHRVAEWGIANNKKLPTIKRVLSAGAPVPATVLRKFSSMLDSNVQIYTPYGATESLPVSSISSREILNQTCYETERGKGICVGYPVDGLEVKIIPICEHAIDEWNVAKILPHGEIGEIVVKGRQVSAAYYQKPEANSLSKIRAPQGGFYHRMGDSGYFDERQRLWFCGRMVHRVVLPEQTLFTVPVEGIFNAHSKVFRTALVGIKIDAVTVPVLCVELNANDKRASKKQVVRELLDIGSRFDKTQLVQRILFHPSFPVDIRHNAKINHTQLAVWAQKKIAP